MNRTSGSGVPLLMRREWGGPFAAVERIPCQTKRSIGWQWMGWIEFRDEKQSSYLFLRQSGFAGLQFSPRVFGVAILAFATLPIEAQHDFVNILRKGRHGIDRADVALAK